VKGEGDGDDGNWGFPCVRQRLVMIYFNEGEVRLDEDKWHIFEECNCKRDLYPFEKRGGAILVIQSFSTAPRPGSLMRAKLRACPCE